jgi:molybdopterin/thiamine biosynthesis adenylyltransferase/rhodanese-related sulfurtransferase
MTTLSQAEISRYSRHIILPEVGPKGQETLKNSSVLLIGAGGLGCPLALYLTAAGIGRIGIVDFDVVDDTNLQRQVLYGESQIGKSKLQSAKERLLDLNPHVKFELFEERLTSDNAIEIFKEFDVVADGTDNFPTRYLVNDACVLANKPNVYGSIFRFEGQISVFNYEGGPCYRCLYSEPPPPGLVPSCAEGGVLGVLPGIVGTMQANEVLKVLLGIGEVASNRLIMFDALKLKFRELKLRKNPDCPLCGDNPSIDALIDYEQFCGIRPAGDIQNESVDERPINEISVQKLKSMMDDNASFELIDVREPHEYELCKIDGSSLIPLNEVESELTQLDPEKTYVIHCKMGGRSAKAVRLMMDQGFSHVTNLAGGINSWAEEIDTSMPTY